MKRMIWALGALWLWVGLSACQEEEKLHIGAKDFAEQKILAEVTYQLLRSEGFPLDPVRECGDTFDCQRALREGRVDMMVDYSGTGLFFLGQPVQAQREQSLEQVRALYKPLGLDWLDPLGFDNNYQVLIPVARSQSEGIQTLADLDKLEGGVRVACPPDFVRRPRDGLDALFARYGLRLAGQPLVLGDVNERLRALRQGRVDVLVGYGTDGATLGLGLVPLEDSLRFFPPYEAALVVRSQTAQRYPELRATLGKLVGRLDNEAMQKLNYAVEVEGHTPAHVARGWLLEQELLPSTAPLRPGRRAPLRVVLHQGDDMGLLEARALRSARVAFPGRAVEVEREGDPVRQVAHGAARLSLVGAERFFSVNKKGRLVRQERLEAAAVVGTRLVHVIRRAGDKPQDSLAGKLGAAPEGSGAGLIADAVLDGRALHLRAPTEHLLAEVKAGRLDAALVVATPGEPSLLKALGEGGLALCSLEGWWTPARGARYPFLRPARVPAHTYKDQSAALESLGSQVVLAGASKRLQSVTTGAGPAAALPYTGVPLNRQEVDRLARATHIPAVPDPALPSAWNTDPSQRPADDGSLQEILSTLLNLLAVVFLIWVVILARPSLPSRPGKP